jgi:uncharacterized protein YbaR (Trm112 family)
VPGVDQPRGALTYPTRDGTPVMLEAEARELDDEELRARRQSG